MIQGLPAAAGQLGVPLELGPGLGLDADPGAQHVPPGLSLLSPPSGRGTPREAFGEPDGGAAGGVAPHRTASSPSSPGGAKTVRTLRASSRRFFGSAGAEVVVERRAAGEVVGHRAGDVGVDPGGAQRVAVEQDVGHAVHHRRMVHVLFGASHYFASSLLSPIKHRGEASQAHIALIRSRDVLVGTRTKLVDHVRGTVKSFGARLPGCSAKSFHVKIQDHLPEVLAPALEPVLETIGSLNERIREYDRELEAISRESYPETALVFVLTLEDPSRFGTSRAVGAYVGLTPGTHQSGEQDPQKRISRRGDETLRRLLVSCAHHVLGPFGEDSDLRRHGEKIAERAAARAPRNARRWR